MRQWLLPVGAVLMLLPAVLGISFLGERMNRQAALERGLEEAAEGTVKMMMMTPYASLPDEKELVAEVLRRLMPAVGEARLSVRLYGADMDYGFLDIGITAESDFPLLGPIVVESRQSVLADMQDAYADAG